MRIIKGKDKSHVNLKVSNQCVKQSCCRPNTDDDMHCWLRPICWPCVGI